jgi:hypothetical protein
MDLFFHSPHLKATSSSDGASAPLLSASVSATHRATNSLHWRLRLPFYGASSFCLHAPPRCAAVSCCVSTGAFISASCRASAFGHTSASRCLPLVWLVVAFPSTSAFPSHRASARRLGLRHSSRLHLSSRPSRSVGCPVAQRLNPHLVATPPGASASTSHCTLARDSSRRYLPPTAASVLYEVSFPRARAGPP